MPSEIERLMTTLAKRTGGIPDFAKEILKQHTDPDEVDRADAAGKAAASTARKP